MRLAWSLHSPHLHNSRDFSFDSWARAPETEHEKQVHNNEGRRIRCDAAEDVAAIFVLLMFWVLVWNTVIYALLLLAYWSLRSYGCLLFDPDEYSLQLLRHRCFDTTSFDTARPRFACPSFRLAASSNSL